jgi:hypothetical protein
MKNMKSFALIMLTALLFWQCSEDSDDVQSSTVSGSAVKGTVVNANVYIYKYDADGNRGDIIASTTTDQNGNFSANVNYSGAVEIAVTGGKYTDEASGVEVSLNEKELRNVSIINGDKKVGITALTTIAAKYVDENASKGLETAIKNANNKVADVFGLTGIDLGSVIPTDLSKTRSATATWPEVKYGGIQAGLSQLVESNQLSPEELLELINAIADDFRDGVIDGKNGAEALQFSSRITPEEAASGLETAINSFLNSEDNRSGRSSNDFYGG